MKKEKTAKTKPQANAKRRKVHITPRELSKEDLPYERFLRNGPKALTERELLAVILRTGTKEKSALELAGDVLSLARNQREGLLGLYDVTLEELMEIKGIGLVKAVKLKCITELSQRISRTNAQERLMFNQASSVAQYFMEQLRHRDTECVILVCLDVRGKMICEKKLSDGSVKMSLISPREIYIEALQSRAVSIVLVHNHPSGDPHPSACDIELTENVAKAGVQLDVPLLDHIIIGDNRYISFREQGYLKSKQ